LTEVVAGTVIDGRYRVLERVGAGGMAEVYSAEDTHLGRKVALKLLHGRFAQDREFVERFRREASSAAGLQHPNVVGVYDRGEFDGTYYIAMEFCEGESLKDLIVREAPLDPRRAIAIAMQILAATRFAHRRGVIHRDLKPQNVIVDSGGPGGAPAGRPIPEDHVKVTDFGIARAGASDITEAGAIMGTAQYLSPEQAHGRQVTEASDLYSIGVVLFEMLTARAPFEGDSAVAVALKHVNQPPPSPREFVPQVPRDLEGVVLKALTKDPAQRYTDADTFMRDLKAVEVHLEEGAVDTESTAVFAPVPVIVPPPPAAAEIGESAAVPPPLVPAPPDAEGPPGEEDRERSMRRRRLLIAAAIAALALAALATYLIVRPGQETVPPVIGQTLDSAQAELEAKGFTVDVKRRSDLSPADTVFDQAPTAGALADEGATVTLFVSNGPSTVKVPDVVGLTEKDAKRRVTSADLRPDIERESSATVAKGIVIRSDPGPGRLIERNSAVTLVVSGGPKEVSVPGVVGQDQEDAVRQLRDAGLSPVVREKSSSEPQGTVVSQSPGAGARVEEGTTVTVFVSNGTVKEVPDVVGLSQARAESQLGGKGFDVAVRTRETSDPTEDGIVLSQSPAGGSERSEGAAVTITVGVVTVPQGQVTP
jgi:serine/threonine-protein kinase